MVCCELAEIFAQVRASLGADHPQRVTLPISSDWTLGYLCTRVCFVISSCFVQQEKWAFAMWLSVEVPDRTRLRKEKGVEATANGVGCPNGLLKVRNPGAEPRLRALRSTFQDAWALPVRTRVWVVVVMVRERGKILWVGSKRPLFIPVTGTRKTGEEITRGSDRE